MNAGFQDVGACIFWSLLRFSCFLPVSFMETGFARLGPPPAFARFASYGWASQLLLHRNEVSEGCRAEARRRTGFADAWRSRAWTEGRSVSGKAERSESEDGLVISAPYHSLANLSIAISHDVQSAKEGQSSVRVERLCDLSTARVLHDGGNARKQVIGLADRNG